MSNGKRYYIDFIVGQDNNNKKHIGKITMELYELHHLNTAAQVALVLAKFARIIKESWGPQNEPEIASA